MDCSSILHRQNLALTMCSLGFIPLHLLLERGRSSEHPVCHDGQRLVLWQEFSARVFAQASLLQGRTEHRWLLTSDDTQTFAINLLALLGAGKQIVIPPNAQPGTLFALSSAFDARITEASSGDRSVAQDALTAIDPHTAIIDIYTSGSTGEPKRVRKSLAQFEAEVQVLESLWGSTLGNAAVLATAPHQHIYGLLFRVLWPLAAGRVFDTATCAHPDTLEQRLTAFDDAVLVSSQAQLSRLPDLMSLATLKRKPKIIFSSGGPLPAVTATTFRQQFGEAPVEIFGSTETGGIAWRSQSGAEGGDGWTPFPGIEVARSELGALTLRSSFLDSEAPWVMDDGIELISGGRFRLLGRLDRIVKIEEKRLSLPDMELRLSAHSWVEAVALVPLSGRRQTIGAVMVLSSEGRKQLESDGRRSVSQILRKYLSEYFEAVLLPRHWRFTESLPLNERGKISHAALTALFAPEQTEVYYPEVIGVKRSEDGDHALILDLHIPPLLAHFPGHFPELPILPGVVQIDWAVCYARQYLALSGGFSALENVKFLGLVLPDDRLQLSLKWDIAMKRLDFSYLTSQRKFSAGRIIFAAA
ncbi:MAG: AMP-binding protein [Betaproteobacteria bacterium]